MVDRCALHAIRTVQATSAWALGGIIIVVAGVVMCVMCIVMCVVVGHAEGVRVARADPGGRIGQVVALVEVRGVVEREIATESELAV